MSDRISISIPADQEGFISLRCPHCEGYFKALAADLNDLEDDTLTCALCGLSHDTSRFLLTPEVNEVVQAEAHNFVADMLNKFSADLERSMRGSKFLQVKASKVDKKPVPELRAITDYAEAELPCCETRIKLPFAQAASLFYCPFCGQAQA